MLGGAMTNDELIKAPFGPAKILTNPFPSLQM